MADETFPEDPGFELIPVGDEDLASADDQLLAAEASLDDDPFVTPGTQPPPMPFGKSWAWDPVRERYKRIGSAPVEVRGTDALREWVYTALRTAQGVHAIFSDEFGIEDPDDWIGLVDPTDAIATFAPRAQEAVTQHDRIEGLDDMNPSYDPSTGVIAISDIVVITDQEEAVALTEIEVRHV